MSENDTPIAISKLAAALANAQKDISTPVKNQTVKMKFKDKNENWQEKTYKYADLSGVIDAIREPLATNEIAYYHKMGYCEGSYGMRTVLIHSSGESIDTWYPLPDPQKQSIRAQDFGGALTYARRYSLSALVGIASEDDDDGQSAPATEVPKQAKKQEPKPAPKAPDKPKDPPPPPAPKPETVKETKVPVSPAETVMPAWGGTNKGKKLGDLTTEVLHKIKDHLSGQLKKTPKPAHVSEIAHVYAQVKAVLVDRGPKGLDPTDDIPENNPHPEDEAQTFPTDDPAPPPPGAEDYVIPKLAGFNELSELEGKPLKQITEKELRAAVKIIDVEMKRLPPKVSTAALFEMRSNIVVFFKEMGLSV